MTDLSRLTEEEEKQLPVEPADVITEFTFGFYGENPEKDERVVNVLCIYNVFLKKRAKLSEEQREAVLRVGDNSRLPKYVNSNYKQIADREEEIVDGIIKNRIIIPKEYPLILARVAEICKRREQDRKELEQLYSESRINKGNG